MSREAKRELFAQRNSHSNRRARCLPYRQIDRSCADFLYCASPLFDKTNGFCYLFVYHQNIKITCRGGVPPPATNNFVPHHREPKIRSFLDRRPRQSETDGMCRHTSLSSSTTPWSPFPAGEGYRCENLCGIIDGTIYTCTFRPLSDKQTRTNSLPQRGRCREATDEESVFSHLVRTPL